ncbi:MAG: biotin--[acetyl-CoA-carboxylase] ligase [Bacteroidota bacterium]
MKKIQKKLFIELSSVDSTNSYASRLLGEQDVEEGTIFYAMEQTAGKGLGENSWESQPGMNLTFSLVLHPTFLKADQLFSLNKAISVGILDFLNKIAHEYEFQLKWPNDIYFGSSKLGGVLISNTILGPNCDTSIIGIGININQTVFSPMLPNPSSLKKITGREIPLRPTLEVLAECLFIQYERLKKEGGNSLDEQYRKHLIGFGTLRNYRDHDMVFQGEVMDVDRFGRLILRIPGQGEKAFAHGEIEILF